MPNYRAVTNGNWSSLATWQDNASGSFVASTVLPGVNDDVYSNGFAVTIDQNVSVRSIRNHLTTGINNNGGFTINTNNRTILASSAISGNGQSNANTITVTVNGTDSCSITTNQIISGDVSGNGIICTGTGITTIVCVDAQGRNAVTGRGVVNSGSGILYFTGNPIGNTQGAGVVNNSVGTIYITGIPLGGSGGTGFGVINSSTGAIYITGGATSSSIMPAVSSSSNGYIKIIGPLTSAGQPAISSSGASAVNILSGPFISSPTGINPISCFRVHYEITANSYYEFRDSSTNGAGTAPPTRLVAPGTAFDSPAANNVRSGITYALGTLTGTLVVPSPANVRRGVPTDNTVGTADLTAQDFFTAIATSPDPIATRLRNVSTVDTTGNQIAAAL